MVLFKAVFIAQARVRSEYSDLAWAVVVEANTPPRHVQGGMPTSSTIVNNRCNYRFLFVRHKAFRSDRRSCLAAAPQTTHTGLEGSQCED